jgi:LAO/AO transport system kinase
VVNKSDREGADRTVRDLVSMLELRGHNAAEVEIVRTVATTGKGIDELAHAVERHRERCAAQREEGIPLRARRRAEATLREQVIDRLRRLVDKELEARVDLVDALARRTPENGIDPYTAADELVRAITARS